ncbi:hypothetical protein HMPREF1635_02110 [Clostridiales bacterium S5-A14a]|jgi:hypothetical protein|nr:hypothetical protein HMPREF1635_02110 [Clostridiales bacterium S5-A14a]
MAKIKKETRIKRENKRLRNKYKELPEDFLEIVDGLLDEAAFMRVELQDMKEDMIANGRIEKFCQSANAKPYDRERPVVRQYNQMVRNYQNIIKQLDEKLPKQSEIPEKPDGFDEFIDI